MKIKKIIIYIALIVILAVLLVLGFRAPQTSQKNNPLAAPKTSNDLKVDANTGDIIEDFRNNTEAQDNKTIPSVKEERISGEPKQPTASQLNISKQDLNSALAGFPLYEKAEFSLDGYRAFRRNNLVDLKEWDESQVAGTPALQVIGNGARAYFEVNFKDAKEFLDFYSKDNLNINGWRYESDFKNDIVEHKPEFKDGSLFAGNEKIERGKHISFALSKDKYFGTWTVFQPRFDDGFLVMYIDVIKE